MSTRKTTDLERLTQPGGKVLPDDATIPVLTERLTLPSLELDISLPQPPPPVVAPPAPVAAPQPAPPPPAPPPPAVAAPKPPPAKPVETPAEEQSADEFAPTVPFDAAQTTVSLASPTTAPLATPTTVPFAPIEINWANAEARVREALLRELQPRLAADIDRQLRERLQPTVVRMLLATITELRPAIDAAIRDVVERAVAAEMARQRTPKDTNR
jgi:hypothetical protein